VVNEVSENSDQAIFTSHSPYVIEEFGLDQIAILAEDGAGNLTQNGITIAEPGAYNYHQYFRSQLCEGLLARRVVICEGATEVSILTGLSRQLAKLNPAKYADLSALGYCLINSQTDSQILNHAGALSGLGKHISVFCDAQEQNEELAIQAATNEAFIHSYQRVEDLLIDNIAATAKSRLASDFNWPAFVTDTIPSPQNDIDGALRRYLGKTKGTGGAVSVLSYCHENEIPQFLLDMIERLTSLARPLADDTDDTENGV
jgi:putative ATP-dependent endonuclease of OLD family